MAHGEDRLGHHCGSHLSDSQTVGMHQNPLEGLVPHPVTPELLSQCAGVGRECASCQGPSQCS